MINRTKAICLQNVNGQLGNKDTTGKTGGSGGGKALGGPVPANMSYLVGENGPELFTPGVGGTITPNNQLSRPRAGVDGGSGNETIHVPIVIGGRVIEDLWIEGRELAIRRGRA